MKNGQVLRGVAGGMQHVPTATPPPPKETCNPSAFGLIEVMAERVISLENRISNVVDRLCGTAPNGEGCAFDMPEGLLPKATMDGQRIDASVSRSHDHLTRLEASLP